MNQQEAYEILKNNGINPDTLKSVIMDVMKQYGVTPKTILEAAQKLRQPGFYPEQEKTRDEEATSRALEEHVKRAPTGILHQISARQGDTDASYSTVPVVDEEGNVIRQAETYVTPEAEESGLTVKPQETSYGAPLRRMRPIQAGGAGQIVPAEDVTDKPKEND